MCGPNGCRETVRACDFCGGLGIVEVEAAERYREGHRLRTARVKASLTQQGLGSILNISPITINVIECGRATKSEQKHAAEIGEWLEEVRKERAQ
jgi:DNA-binding XRE family transcriptional regulator